MKRFIAILMVAMLLISGIGQIPAKAMVNEGVSTCTVNINKINAGLTISSSGKASITANLATDSGNPVRNSITVYLMKKNGSTWSTVSTWTKSASSRMIFFSTTKQLSSKGTYKVKVIANTQVGKSYEMYTIYSPLATY